MRRILIVFSLLLLSLLALLPVIAQDEGAAYVRVAHFSPDAPAVDIYIDGTVAIPALAFPTITDFVQLTAGSHTIVIAPAGTSIDDAVIGPAEITFAADSWTTIAAIGSVENGTLAPAILGDDFSATDGQARVTVFHAIEGAPAVDVLAGGEAVITRLGYPGTIGANDGAFTIEVAPGTYDISVTANGDATAELLSAPGTVLEADNIYFIAAVGTADSPQLAVASFNPLSVVQGPAPEETAEATAEATVEATPEVTEEPPGTIIDEATAAGNFTTLLAAIEAAGLTETLSGEGTFTVFAPTDEAFAALLDEMGVAAEDVMADTDLLTSILQYHITDVAISGTQVASLDGFAIGTLNGEPISVTVNDEGGVVLNDTVNVVTTDIPASNGVIHVIDAVLLPPTGDVTGDDQSIAQGNLIDVATEAGDFTILLAAVEAAGLTDTLANGGPFTVFAPSDIAFEVLLDELGLTAEELLADTELLTSVLTYHVVEGEVFSADLEDGDLTTLNGAVITLDVTEGGNVFVNDAMVAVTDLTASNGVIHVIDGVLLPPIPEATPEATAEATAEATPEVTEEPPGTIIDEATAAGSFTTLLAAVEAAGLTETLSGEGTFTVFAPTDEAFAAFLDEQGMTAEELLADTELLTSVLQYHVTDNQLSSAQIASLDGFAIGTLNGASIRVSVNDDGDVVLNDTATVVAADIAASNGVIHVIDAVLSPEDGGRGRR